MADIFDELESGDIFDQIEPEAEPGQFGGGQGGQFGGTGTTGKWEKPDLAERAINYEDKLIGGLTKGGMRLGEAILRAPAMAVRQAGFLRQVGMANRILQEPDPKRQASMLADMEASKQAFDSIAETLDKPAELHKVGQRIIEQNHPEWASNPPESFVDLLTHPDKLGVALAESTPILLGAGILTAAGMPNVAVGMMYVAEGQSAHDQAIEDGASEEDAALAYAIYGSVSAALENMQLQGIIKVAKGSYNALLNRTVQKVAKQGLKSLTGEAIKVAAQEALEEMSQGAWQELTAKMVYDKSVPGGVAGFIDRRAQEGYLGFMMGLVPAAGGGVVGAIKGGKQVGSVAVQEQTTEQPIEQPTEQPTEQTTEQPIKTKVESLPEIQKEVQQYDALIEKVQEGDKRAAGRLNNLVQGFDRPTYDSLLEKVQEGDQHAMDLIEAGFYQGGKPFGTIVAQKQVQSEPQEPLSITSEPQVAGLGGLGEVEASTQEKVVEPPKPKRITPRQALKIGHDLPKKMGWSEAQRYDFNQQVVGKRSMKDMSPQEKQMVAHALQEQARDAGLLPPEDYPKTLFVGAEEVETDKFMEDAIAQVESLKDRSKKIPKIITHKFRKDVFAPARWVKDVTVGLDNLDIVHLMDKIGATVEGPLKKLNDYIRSGKHKRAAVKRQGVGYINDAIKQAGITAKDLAEYGRSLDPRMELIKTTRELIGKPKTKYYDLNINSKTIRMSMAELTDVYLTYLQSTGPGHIEGGGISIFKYDTGPVPKPIIDKVISLVENDKVASVLVKAFVDAASNVNAPQLNYTNGRLNPETIDKLADEENYWHVETKKKKRILGKETYKVSFLENKGFLKPRQGGTQPVVIRNAFDKFFALQDAVAEYVGMAEPIRLLNMVLNYDPVIEGLEAKGYDKIRDNIKTLVEEAQSSGYKITNTDRVLGRILHGAYRALLHFSPKVVPIQYLSTIHYAGVLPPEYVAGLAKLPTPSLVKRMLDHSPVAWERLYGGGANVEMAELGDSDASLRLLTGKHSDVNKTAIGIQTSDILTFAKGWDRAEVWVSGTTNLKEGTPGYWDAVNEKAELLWETQPQWDKWGRSINTSRHGIAKLPFLFRSYYQAALGMLHTANATYEGSAKTATDKAKWAQAYGAVISSQMVTSLWRTFIGWALWKERRTLWDYIAGMATSGLGMVSVVGGYMQRVVGNAIKIMAGEKTAYEGDPLSTLPGQLIEQTLIGTKDMTYAASYHLAGDDKKRDQKIKSATKKLIRSIGTMRGIPVNQIEKIIKAVEPEKVEGGWVYE